MVLPIVTYGHPVLRQKGARVESVTAAVAGLVRDMFDTMYQAAGIGLAAQQVGHALQITVIDVRGIKDRPSSLELDGRAAEVEAFMPLVLINPEIKLLGAPVPGPEGCLSFPEIFEEVIRPASVEVSAVDLNWRPVRFVAGGLLARAVQHETDHLNGILFIDRMTSEAKQALKPELEALQAATKAALRKKG